MPLKSDAEQKACPWGVMGTHTGNNGAPFNAECGTTRCMAWIETTVLADKFNLFDPSQTTPEAARTLEAEARRNGKLPVPNSVKVFGVPLVWGTPSEMQTGHCIRLRLNNG
jgi:hypothetical protein